jgi:hypothetical protein
MIKHSSIHSISPQKKLLGDVARVFSGIGISKEEAAGQNGIRLPVIGVRDLQDGEVSALDKLDSVGFPDPERAKTYAVRADDVLITGRGTLLKCSLVGSETEGAIASANIIVVRPGSSATGGALYAILSSEVFLPKIEVLRRGATTLLSLSTKDLAKLEVVLPPIEEQRRVSALVREAQTAYRTAVDAAETRRTLVRRLIDSRLFGDKKNTERDHV